MKFFALYFIDSRTKNQALDSLYENGKKFNFFFVPVPQLVDLPDCLKRLNVGITRWGFFGIARSTADYNLRQLQNNISQFLFYEEIPIDGELTAWFEQHCSVKKLEIVNPRSGRRRIVTKVTTTKASSERDKAEERERYKREVEPRIDAMKFFWKETEKIEDAYAERLIDMLIQLQTDYNKKLNDAFERYWYNKRKGFDYAYNMIQNDLMPDIALEYIAYTESLLLKYAKIISDLPDFHAIVAETRRRVPDLFETWEGDELSLKAIKHRLEYLIESKTRESGVKFFFEIPSRYISYLNLDFYIDPASRQRPQPQPNQPPPTKKPRIVYPPNFKK